jgi:hypothetical protein
MEVAGYIGNIPHSGRRMPRIGGVGYVQTKDRKMSQSETIDPDLDELRNTKRPLHYAGESVIPLIESK